jgi:hypothetical protein
VRASFQQGGFSFLWRESSSTQDSGQVRLIAVAAATLRQAEQQIESCEHCHPADAEIPFDWLLAEVTGKRGPYEFILGELARCPNCKAEIREKTLVEPKD